MTTTQLNVLKRVLERLKREYRNYLPDMELIAEFQDLIAEEEAKATPVPDKEAQVDHSFHYKNAEDMLDAYVLEKQITSDMQSELSHSITRDDIIKEMHKKNDNIIHDLQIAREQLRVAKEALEWLCSNRYLQLIKNNNGTYSLLDHDNDQPVQVWTNESSPLEAIQSAMKKENK